MTTIISTSLGLLLLALQPVIVLAQTETLDSGRWESVEEHFRLIFYQHQDSLQILFYGRIEIGDEHNQYVTRAVNIHQDKEILLFELPPHSVYSNAQGDIASAGHQSELPARDQVEKPTFWRLIISQATLMLDCAAVQRKLCGISQPVELHLIQ